jgi:hypothetical protein
LLVCIASSFFIKIPAFLADIVFARQKPLTVKEALFCDFFPLSSQSFVIESEI